MKTGSPFDNKALPAWEHQHAFDSIRGKYYFKAQALPSVLRFKKIGGTTGDYYAAIREAFPAESHPDLYEEFPNVSGPSIPIGAVVAMIRDNFKL